MIDVHYWPTPNGKKVTILLEELGTPYNIVPCHIGKGDQFKAEFLKIGPNNRMPAIVDHEPADGGPPISIFECGAIMKYLAEKAGRFYPSEVRRRYEVNQWVLWQMANQGPKLGECGHFLRRATNKATSPTPCAASPTRPTDSMACSTIGSTSPLSRRRRIHHRRHDQLSLDRELEGPRQEIEEFKYFKRWFEELSARPAVQRGLAVTAGPAEDPDSLSAEERERRTKLLYNQRARPAPEGGLV